MFGLIGHSTSFEEARAKARTLGFEEFADGDLDVWCSAPPQLVERLQVTSATGKTIDGAYIDSCFVPEMLSRFKTARRKVLSAMELAQKNGIDITALGGFTSIIFENFNLLKEQQIRSTTLDWERFTTGNTHTAWVICRQVETNAPRLGIDLAQARVAVEAMARLDTLRPTLEKISPAEAASLGQAYRDLRQTEVDLALLTQKP